MSSREELLIGLMSGTSVDGIDAALVAFTSYDKLRVLETQFTPFPAALRTEINNAALNNAELFCNEDSPLHTTLASHYASASLDLIEKSGVAKQRISGIANHGQTVRHEPNASPPFSLQLGDGQNIADLTGLPVITQFRQADLEAGGQGAPLMPAFHSTLFGGSKQAFILNLGGIANITQLSEPVIGFDTGPGNTLMDQWIDRHQQKKFDADGAWANGGQLIDSVLRRLMQTQYLHDSHPKSTGTDFFNLHWLTQAVPDLQQHSPQDIQATLLSFTVNSVALALQQLQSKQGTVYVCGGGANNGYLMHQLEQNLNRHTVRTTDELGVPADWVEAVGFAWLGYCYQHNIDSNLPSVTGARKPLVLGQQYSPQTKGI